MPGLYATYVAERQRLGLPVPPPPRPKGPLFLHVTEDPERSWHDVAPHVIYTSNSNAEWAKERGVGATPYPPLRDVDDLKASPQFAVVTPQQCVDLIEGLVPDAEVALQPLMGGLDPDLGSASLELFATRGAAGSSSAPAAGCAVRQADATHQTADLSRTSTTIRPGGRRRRGCVDRSGREDRLQYHHRGPGDARLVAELARDDPQAAGGQGQRPAVDHLSDSGQELLACTGDVSADDDDGRVEHVHARRQHAADGVPGLAHEAYGVWLAREHLGDHVPAGPGRQPELGEPRGQRAAAGDGLQAAEVAAPAYDVVVIGDVDVADVAGRAVGPPVDVTAGHEPASDPRADLDEHQERLVAPARPVLADSHDVHVVVDEGEHPEPFGQSLADGVAGASRA